MCVICAIQTFIYSTKASLLWNKISLHTESWVWFGPESQTALKVKKKFKKIVAEQGSLCLVLGLQWLDRLGGVYWVEGTYYMA